jgi:hypothetical protein
MMAAPALGAASHDTTPPQRPLLHKPKSSGIGALLGSNRLSKGPRLEDEIRITIHIAETLARQKYLVKLCRALMAYGAPTHRMEGERLFSYDACVTLTMW